MDECADNSPVLVKLSGNAEKLSGNADKNAYLTWNYYYKEIELKGGGLVFKQLPSKFILVKTFTLYSLTFR